MCFGPPEEETKPPSVEAAPRASAEPSSQRPSWVPDLRSKPGERPFIPLTHYQSSNNGSVSEIAFDSKIAFNATKSSSAAFIFVEDASELIVSGRQIGVITDSGYEPVKDWKHKALAGIQALVNARSLAEGLEPDGRDLVDEFWRTLITNRAMGGEQPPPDFPQQFETWWQLFFDPSTATVEKRKQVEGYTAAFNQHYFARDFFVTKEGHMGLCPLTRRIGDVVCLLAGAQVPFVLRPDGERYRVVGECYVHGVMKGEKWDASTLQTFTLF